MKPGILIQLGGRRRFIVANALSDLNLLNKIYCDFLLSDRQREILCSIPGAGKRLGALISNRILPDSVSVTPTNHLPIMCKNKISTRISKVSATQTALNLGHDIQRQLDITDLSEHGFIYAYDKAAAYSMKLASDFGIKAILDQTIAPNDEMQKTLIQHAEFAGIEYKGLSQLDLELVMEEQETSWKYASVIVCGSEFVRSVLKKRGIVTPIIPIRPIFHGFYGQPPRLHKWDKSRPLRLITVGQVSFRKGAHLSFNAAKKIGNAIEWHFIGNVSEDILPLTKNLPSNVNLCGFKRGLDLIREYQWADVFVFPSLWEGSAYAVIEAAGLGLPCIVSHSSGAWTQSGLDGIVLDNCSTETLANAIYSLLDNPHLIEQMSRNAIEASDAYNWDNYKYSILNAIDNKAS